MNDNYKTTEHLIRKYSFEFLKVSPEPLSMLELLNILHPESIIEAKKSNLLAAAIIYIYLKRNHLNGRGGITAKDLERYFDVKSANISQKASDISFRLSGFKEESEKIEQQEIYEFIDDERYEINEEYFSFLESNESEIVEEGIKVLKSIIAKDRDFYDPYITLHEYYVADRDFKKAIKILEEGYARAIKRISKEQGRFPDKLNWIFIENRHIIRVIFNYAIFLWSHNEEKKEALNILQLLLKSNPNDNIGARYSIVAILEGIESQDAYEAMFLNRDGESLNYEKLEKWFEKCQERS